MSRIQYDEVQRFWKVRWIWFGAIAILLVPIVLTVNDESIDRDEITKILLTALFAPIPLVGFLIFAKFEIKVNEQGIQYRFFPIIFRWRLISIPSIASFDVVEKRGLFEKIHCGYHRNRIRNVILVNITGSKFVHIKLHDGSRIKLGSDNPTELEYALKRLTKVNDL